MSAKADQYRISVKFGCPGDYKFRGAISKYGSNSQHKRLATLDHVQKSVLKMAKTTLKIWSGGHFS